MNEIKKLTEWFTGQVGVREQGENNVKYNTDYYGAPVHGAAYPWCCAFIWDGFRECGLSSLFCGGEKTAWCPYVVNYAREHGQWVTGEYRAGDVLLFDWDKDGKADHIGFCVAVNGSTLTDIEGNVQESVMKLTRSAASVMGAFRPIYAKSEESAGNGAPHQSAAPTASPQGEAYEAPYPGAVENEDYYVTKWGDTLWGIAEEFLGDGNLYPLLTQLNGVTAETLKPGMVILLHPEDMDEDEDDTEKDSSAAPQNDKEAPHGSYMLSLRVLKRGDSGATVKQFQRLLIATGYKLRKYGADGDFGEETEEAAKLFQKDNRLAQNGAIDHDTAAKLLGL